jgi:hypothetical protein
MSIHMDSTGTRGDDNGQLWSDYPADMGYNGRYIPRPAVSE